MILRPLPFLVCSVLLSTACLAQMGSTGSSMGNLPDPAPAAPLASPVAKASVKLMGKSITVDYNSPSMRHRKIMGGLVPWGKVWRTGANSATTLKTATDLKLGELTVPAGTYTLFTVPNADQWLLIVNKQTGQWGLAYDEKQDLGRTPMMGKTLTKPQEAMSISFENTSGPTTEMHIRWETSDELVKLTAK